MKAFALKASKVRDGATYDTVQCYVLTENKPLVQCTYQRVR